MSSDLFSKCICNVDEPENRGASDSVWWTDQKSQGNVVLHTQKPQGEAQMKHSPDCKHPWSPGQYYFSTSGVLSIFLTVCFQITQCDRAWRKTDSKIFHWSKLKGKKFAPVLEVATKFYTFHIILKKNPSFFRSLARFLPHFTLHVGTQVKSVAVLLEHVLPWLQGVPCVRQEILHRFLWCPALAESCIIIALEITAL